MDVDIDLRVQVVAQDAILQDEANTQEINRVQAGSNKISFRNDLAKDKMIFSEESSRAIYEMDSVEPIELKKNLGTKYNGADPRSIRRIESPSLSYCTNISRGKKCGPNPWQQDHHEARDASRGATKKEKYTPIWDRWQNDEVYRASQLAHNWTDAWVKYLDFIVHFDISHNALSWQMARDNNMIHVRSLDSNKQAGPLSKSPGHKEATRALMSLQYAEGQGVLCKSVQVKDSSKRHTGS